jgi:hypothetical protein
MSTGVEIELNVYTRVHQVSLDTDLLMRWKQNVQEFPRLDHMTMWFCVF